MKASNRSTATSPPAKAGNKQPSASSSSSSSSSPSTSANAPHPPRSSPASSSSPSRHAASTATNQDTPTKATRSSKSSGAAASSPPSSVKASPPPSSIKGKERSKQQQSQQQHYQMEGLTEEVKTPTRGSSANTSNKRQLASPSRSSSSPQPLSSPSSSSAKSIAATSDDEKATSPPYKTARTANASPSSSRSPPPVTFSSSTSPLPTSNSSSSTSPSTRSQPTRSSPSRTAASSTSPPPQTREKSPATGRKRKSSSPPQQLQRQLQQHQQSSPTNSPTTARRQRAKHASPISRAPPPETEKSPTRVIGGAPLAPTSPEERSFEQQQPSPGPSSVYDVPSELTDPELAENISGESVSAEPVEESSDLHEHVIHEDGQQVTILIPRPLMLTSTIGRGPYHQCGSARRVKVYELTGETWQDRGTGYCAGIYDEAHDAAIVVARLEEETIKIEDAAADSSRAANGLDPLLAEGSDGDDQAGLANALHPFYLVISENLEVEENMLKSRVVEQDVYQKQQDTLIVWTEPDGTDMALSFQEAEGCHEVWEFIVEVQRHFRANQVSVDNLSDPPTPDPGSPAMGDFSTSGMPGAGLLHVDPTAFALPDPDLGNLQDINVLLKNGAHKGPQAREGVAEWLVATDFLRKLVPVFHSAEDLEELDCLHDLCSIMQTVVMLNDSMVVESLLADDIFFSAVGMFEYDPEFPTLKASYRDYLRNTAKFKQVVDIDDPKIVTKIHQTYRIQYLKDVILARILDDAMFSVLNSWIFFHQVDIVNYCTTNELFLMKLYEVCAPDSDEPVEKKHDAVFFLQHLCAMGKQIQLPARIGLYRTLAETGLLDVLEFALFEPVQKVQNAAAEMLMVVIEYDPNSIRNHVLQQVDRKAKTLVSVMADILHTKEDLGLKAQVTDSLRVLFDNGPENGPPNASLAAAAAAARTKGDPARFLSWFYDCDVEHLFSPLKRLPRLNNVDVNAPLELSPRHVSALYAHLCDLLCYTVAQHTFRSQYYVITSDIAAHVGALLFAREKHLRLAAVKFFRACLASNNQFTNRNFIQQNIFGALLTLSQKEGQRDTLVLSACIEFFDHIRKDKPRILLAHLAEQFTPKLNALAANRFAGPCFQGILNACASTSEGGAGVSLSQEKSMSGSSSGSLDDSSSSSSSGFEGGLLSKKAPGKTKGSGTTSAWDAAATTGSASEEAYFDEEEGEEEDQSEPPPPPTRTRQIKLKRKSGNVAFVNASQPSTTTTTQQQQQQQLPGIGGYADDEEDEGEDDIEDAAAMVESEGDGSGPVQADTSSSDLPHSPSSSTTLATSAASSQTPTPNSTTDALDAHRDRLSEKRRRSEAEEDAEEAEGVFGRMAKRRVSATVGPVGSTPSIGASVETTKQQLPPQVSVQPESSIGANPDPDSSTSIEVGREGEEEQFEDANEDSTTLDVADVDGGEDKVEAEAEAEGGGGGGGGGFIREAEGQDETEAEAEAGTARQ